MTRYLAAALLCALAAPPAGADGLQPFDAYSLAAIRTRETGKPFVLAFWSTICEPCRDEIILLRAAQRRFPGVNVHLVAVDPPAARADVEAFLRRYDPGRVERWAFADEFGERVRYAVDPAWRGEIPRTYLYDESHRRQALNGRLDRQHLEAWLGKHSSQTGLSRSAGGH